MAVTRQRTPRPGTIVHWPREVARGKQDLSLDVVSMAVTKSLAAPSGAFTLSLLPIPTAPVGPARGDKAPRYYATIRPGDLISIGFDEPGGIMLGIVDRVARSVQEGPVSNYTVTVTGRDFGKILVQDQIIHASLSTDGTADFAEKLEEVVGEGHPLVEVTKGIWGPDSPATGDPTPGVFVANGVQAVVDFIVNTSISMTLPHRMFDPLAGAEETPANFIDTDGTVSTWNDARIYSEGLNSYQGSIWGFLQSVLDPDFYEVYFQTVPNGAELPRVSFIVRPKPFDEELLKFWPTAEEPGTSWEDLRPALVSDVEHHIVERDQVLGMNLGRSEADVFSYFEVTARHDLIGNDAGFQIGLYYPLIDTYQLKRYGVRAYRTQLSLAGNSVLQRADGEQVANAEDTDRAEVHEFRGRLFNWYRLADFFEAGSVRVAGRDRFRPGDPVFLPFLEGFIGGEKGLRFYCPAVSWEWTYGQPYTCTLQLTRGHNNGVVQTASDEIFVDSPIGNPQHFVES